MPGPVDDPYVLLGLDRSAGEAEIRSAFRRGAAKVHPDLHPGDEGAQRRFRELNAAYQLLNDSKRRRRYDMWGIGVDGDELPEVDLGGFGDLFSDFLGAVGVRSARTSRARATVELSLQEAATGCKKSVSYDRQTECDSCEGRGGIGLSPCNACRGRGKIRGGKGLFRFRPERRCEKCRGRGQKPKSLCTPCAGSGQHKRRVTLEVDFPSGLEDAQSYAVKGEGHHAPGTSTPGDLDVRIKIGEHEFLSRDGANVRCALPISFPQAALGTTVEVETLQGRASLKIPPGTQPGQVLRMKGLGVPHRVRAGSGDQLVDIRVRVPTEMTETELSLVEELGREFGDEVRQEPRTFVRRLKRLFL